MRIIWFFTVLVCCAVGTRAAEKRPWQQRVGQNVEVRHRQARQPVTPDLWPEEPGSPVEIDQNRFKKALQSLCGVMPRSRLENYSRLILEESARFEVDPFLLGALIYDQSRCIPRTPDGAKRHGVTRIDLSMHAPHIRSGKYTYFVREKQFWEKKNIPVNQYPFNKWKLQRVPSNIYFSAAILRMFTLQCSHLDETTDGVAHRHPVSHWFFGDRVRDTGPEDRVLTVRRRFLQYYGVSTPGESSGFNGLPLVSPLDGAPRLVLDYFGNPRGKRNGPGHRGIDIDGVLGEPVRAVAAGRVTFAGVDLPGELTSTDLTPEEAMAYPNHKMGKGGLYVRIYHGNNLHSVYMHLNALGVSKGDRVAAGDKIGELGRSGTVSSGPHLHLEIANGVERIDPALPLSTVLANPFAEPEEPATHKVAITSSQSAEVGL